VTTLLGGLLVGVGSFLPWVTVASAFYAVSFNGVGGGKDGVLTLILGVVAVAIGAVRLVGMVPPTVQHLSGLLGVGVLALGFFDLEEVQRGVAEFSAQQEYGTAFTGAGLYTILVGGGLVTIGGLISQRPAQDALSTVRDVAGEASE
jgi:hypothetical protein